MKSRGVYIILGVLGGTLGLHNFYSGHYGSGVAKILIGVFALLMAVVPSLDNLPAAAFISIIAVGWVIIELVTTKQDVTGTPFRI